jgi:allantoate deiminase/N-carbamoyl-L-amino-acid hydrolase
MSYLNIERVKEMVCELGNIGRTDQGGVTRLTYSPEYKAGMEYLTDHMKAAGMQVFVDPVGNLIGTYQGTDPELPAVMTGSHLDSVPEGGKLDGALGLATSIECVRSWHETGWKPRRTVKVIATIEEEGTLFGLGCMGSRALAGELAAKSPEEIKDAEGRSLAWHMQQMGLDPRSALQDAKIDPKKTACYVELHVEQGEDLVLADIPCAVVTDIIGLDRHWIAIQGRANHAGTTRMNRRCDALVAAADLITQVNQLALSSNGRYVATVGTLEVMSGAINIIPGNVVLGLEARFAKPEVLKEVRDCVDSCIKNIETRHGVQVKVVKHLYSPPVSLGNYIVEKISDAARETGVRFIEMPSWAGHDAKILATIFPAGMIFVPSLNGISHAPGEATKWEAVAEGLKVLNQTLKNLSTLV